MAHAEAGTKNLLEDLPMDVAGGLFEHLSSPSDLLHVAQASKSLFRLAIRRLYREISYETPAHFFHNQSFWQRTDLGLGNIVETPRSVVIGKKLGQGFVPEVQDRGWFIPRTPLEFAIGSYMEENKETFPPAFFELFERLVSFPNLRRVSFQHARFPSDIYATLGQLPKGIYFLSFEQCAFDSTFLPMTTPDMVAELSITELNLSGSVLKESPRVRTTASILQSVAQNRQNRANFDMYQILIRSPHIRALCLEWNRANASRFSRDPDLPTPAFSRLEYLELRSWNQNNGTWRSESDSPQSNAFLRSVMRKLLVPCNRLTELVLFGYFPGVAPTSAPVLPALKSYTGPMDFLRSALRGCDKLEKIILSGTIKDIDALMTNALPYNASRALRYFEVTLEEWDVEIMYAVRVEIPAVEELRIKYWKGYPDEDLLISFGAEFLSYLPNILVLQIYRPHDDHRGLDMTLYNQHVSTWSRFPSPPTYLDDGLGGPQAGPLSSSVEQFGRHLHPGLPPLPPAHHNNMTGTNAGTGPGPFSNLNIARLHRTCACHICATSHLHPPSYLYPRPHPLRQHQRIEPPAPAAGPAPATVPISDIGPCGLPNAHEYVVGWQKNAPGLREVKLVDAFVWRRAGVGDDWCRRDLKVFVDEEEEERREKKWKGKEREEEAKNDRDSTTAAAATTVAGQSRGPFDVPVDR
ncbi:hypothetical protein D9757_001597 [Collybiopsis confluens]|uniref:F-box domain-containing protein n=1 Tax=Collybiopsis confluens TaxID=2823264 RepID=A0A8H5MFM2_9AGAR|nr:hypothetical protein D9757_001597 [Collybiopsis confluens]